MRITWARGILLIALLSVCGDPAAPVRSGSGGESQPIATWLNVVCLPDGSTEIVDPTVAAEADGVHIRLDNRAGESVSLNGAGLDFPKGISEQVAAVPPGLLEIACWPFSMHRNPEPERIAVTVEDPEGYWRSPELECSRNDMIASMINDYAAPLSGTEGNPESLARDRIKSLEPDDAVFTVGYPEAEYRQIGIERDSSLVAVVNFSLIPDGGWLLGGYDACDSAQIRV